MSTAISVSALRFSWDDGTPVFTGLDLDLGPGRTGLIGVNGSGKSTLLRLLAGELRPTSGSITITGEIGYLPQDLPLAGSRPVSDLLGISEIRAALHAIERGDVDEENLALVENAWDVEERARAELDRLGLGAIELDRTVTELSGGEAMLVALAGLLARRPAVLLLDEPTNNLDLVARQRLYAAIDAWTGVLVMVSHDRALLDRVDRVADLRDGEIRIFGGNLSAYDEVLAVEKAAAERMVRSAEADLRREKRELIEARIKLDRRERYAKKDFENKRRPKVIMQARKREAQVSAGKLRDLHTDRIDSAKERLTQAEARVRADAEIRVELPETRVPAGRTVVTLSGVRTVVGPVPDLVP
ncbi:MAG TPA: ATP-binding cassette domain-containing protein, partial [Actinopolymorphaceae bacterium]